MEDLTKKQEENTVVENISEEDNVDNNVNLDNESEEMIEPEMSVMDLVDELSKERDEYKDKYLRLYAEFDNYKKRHLKDYQYAVTNSKISVLGNILTIVDDFENAIKMNETNEDVVSMKDGFNMIFNKFISTLESLKVTKIDTKDADFNTDYHEAVVMFDGTEEQHNKVIDCVQTGYMYDGQVLRHSKVVVGK